jgi:WD40 repeat protein
MYKVLLTLLLAVMVISVVSAQDYRLEEGIWDAKWSPDGELLAVANPGGHVYVYNRSGVLIQTIVGHDERALSVAWSPDSSIVASGGWDNVIKFWTVDTAALIGEISVWGAIGEMDWQRNGSYLATATSDTVQVWDTATYQPVTIGAGVTLLDIEWSPDDGQFAFAATGGAGIAKISGNQFDVTLLTSERERVTSVAWSNDGTQIISTDNVVRVWDATTYEQISVLDTGTDPFQDAVFLNDNNTQILAITTSGSVYTFDVTNGEVVETSDTGAFLWAIAWNSQESLVAIAGTQPLRTEVSTNQDATQATAIDTFATGFLQITSP